MAHTEINNAEYALFVGLIVCQFDKGAFWEITIEETSNEQASTDVHQMVKL